MGIFSFLLCAIASLPMRMPMSGEVQGYEENQHRKGSDGVNYGSIDETINSANNERLSSRRRRSSVTFALQQMRIETGHTRQSIIRHERRRRSTMLGSFQAVGHTPLIQLADFGFGESLSSLRSKFSAGGHGSLFSIFGEGEDDMEERYTLGELSISKTNVWLNAFTLIGEILTQIQLRCLFRLFAKYLHSDTIFMIACFPFLNMQSESEFV
jgi:hypothetical protein